MPSPQLVSTNDMSPSLRAEIISGGLSLPPSSLSPSQLVAEEGSGRSRTISRPLASVRAVARRLPEQLSVTLTIASPTGLPSASEVTQTSELPRPHLKWTAMLVTSAVAAT